MCAYVYVISQPSIASIVYPQARRERVLFLVLVTLCFDNSISCGCSVFIFQLLVIKY